MSVSARGHIKYFVAHCELFDPVSVIPFDSALLNTSIMDGLLRGSVEFLTFSSASVKYLQKP